MKDQMKAMTDTQLTELIAAAKAELASRTVKRPEPIRFHDFFEADRYNGGWCKIVSGLDKSKNNGYSILGNFVDAHLMGIRKPGLYLDCNIDGSRKHPRKNYRLFRYDGDTVTVLHTLEDGGKDWAVRLWPEIEVEVSK